MYGDVCSKNGSAIEVIRETVGVLGFADIADTFEYFDNLLAELRAAGAILRIENGFLSYDVPQLPDSLMERMRLGRDGLIAAIRRDEAIKPEEVQGAELIKPALLCPSCGQTKLTDRPDGFECSRCKRLAWVCTANGGVRRADWNDGEENNILDPGSIPKCPGCNDLCDAITATDQWACRRCDPGPSEETLRVLELREDLLGRTGYSSSGLRFRSIQAPRVDSPIYLNRLIYDMKLSRSTGIDQIFNASNSTESCASCGSTGSYLALIHQGESLRRDCSRCGLFRDNPVWRDAAAVDAYIKEFKAQPLGQAKISVS